MRGIRFKFGGVVYGALWTLNGLSCTGVSVIGPTDRHCGNMMAVWDCGSPTGACTETI